MRFFTRSRRLVVGFCPLWSLCVAACAHVSTAPTIADYTPPPVALLQQTQARSPDNAQAHLLCARRLGRADHIEESIVAYERARSLGANDRALYVELSSAYDVSARYAEALQVYGDWLAQNPKDTEMAHEMGLTLLLCNRPAEASHVLARAAAHAPADVQLHHDLGYAHLCAGNCAQAEVLLRQVLQAADSPPEHAKEDLIKALRCQADAQKQQEADALQQSEALGSGAPAAAAAAAAAAPPHQGSRARQTTP